MKTKATEEKKEREWAWIKPDRQIARSHPPLLDPFQERSMGGLIFYLGRFKVANLNIAKITVPKSSHARWKTPFLSKRFHVATTPLSYQ